MTNMLAEATRNWSAEHPRVVEALTPLAEVGVAIFSSTYNDIVRRALDLPPARRPGDIDLLVPRARFGLATRQLGGTALISDVEFWTSDSKRARMRARETLAHVDGYEIQFMDPQEQLRVGTARYNTVFSPRGAAMRTVVETNEGMVPLAHPAHTLGMYAILQRAGGKDDLAGAATLIGMGTLTDIYTAECALAMGWDERVWDFVGRASILALEGARVETRSSVGMAA